MRHPIKITAAAIVVLALTGIYLDRGLPHPQPKLTCTIVPTSPTLGKLHTADGVTFVITEKDPLWPICK
jgi:Ni,Fe-hydrogenase I cytochrome b subunit